MSDTAIVTKLAFLEAQNARYKTALEKINHNVKRAQRAYSQGNTISAQCTLDFVRTSITEALAEGGS